MSKNSNLMAEKRILLYIPKISKIHGGVYQYATALLKILGQSNSKDTFFVLCPPDDEFIEEIIRRFPNFQEVHLEDENKTSKVLKKRGIYYINRIIWKFRLRLVWEREDPLLRLLKKNKIDIIHSPVQYVPKYPDFFSIVTLHDVQELHFPQFFSSKIRAHRAVSYKQAIEQSDKVVVSYNHVKEDLVKYFDVDPSRVEVIHLDMKDLWFESLSSNDILSLEEKNLPKDFILYPAATWEHKNHFMLLEALKVLKNKGITINLVCTGHKTPFFQKIEDKIQLLSLTHQVTFLGVVTDQELFSLYHKCRAVVIPTLYEAGSFPLMESILMGIPVVCSNVTSLPSTIGENSFVFDPLNPVDIAGKIEMICRNEEYRIKNLYIGAKKAKVLRESNAGEQFSDVYQSFDQQ